jgi:hypothetical protein
MASTETGMKRSSVMIGLLMGALLLAGCGITHIDSSGARIRHRTYRPEPQTSKQKENYLQIRGKGKATPRFGFVRVGYELFAPWKLGLKMGGFDLKALQYSLDQQGCVELDVPASNPLEYAAFCGFKTSLGGDWQFTVGYSLGGSTGQSAFVNFPAAGDVMRMKVEADASSMISFYAKAPADVDWTMVEQLNAGLLGYDLTQDSLLPAVGGANLNNKGEIGFASFWGSTASRPSPTDEEMVLDHTLEGIKLSLKAVQRLDGLFPDDVNALDHLNEAKLNYQWASDYIDLNFPETKENKKALKSLGKAIKLTDKAIEKTQDGNYKSAASKSGKAAKQGDKAGGIYLQIPLNF